MSTELHLAVNNENGNLTGRVEAIDVWIDGDIVARFESEFDAVCKFNQSGISENITIGKTTLNYSKYMTYVGNICWNSYTVKPIDLYRLFNILRDSGDWSLIEAYIEIMDIWESGRDFCPEDFGERESVAAKLEAVGYPALFDLNEAEW